MIGKFQEELGELQTVLARCIIQGIDEINPTTGQKNREWLLDEMADVSAMLQLLLHIEKMKLDPHRIISKFHLKMDWLESLS